jgi:hypothetical protein
MSVLFKTAGGERNIFVAMWRYALPFGLVVGLAGISAKSQELAMNKMTPILVVDEIEPSLDLWVDRLGFTKTAEVPEGNRLGFVILARDRLELMYQTRASIRKEVEEQGLPEALLPPAAARSVLFCEVADLAAIRERVKDLDVLLSYRKTAYGAEELWLREPGGHVIGFAQFPEPD